ncbi:heme/hemin ABC transporter substrate-binding protein [Pedobacter hartonius]|uniref:Iron complex transport system substrate-binding protein n=1 Tax=Pedobacter hartonius TaxID=425514 RepID=A0A1H4B8X5_9SPHI|nr:helical backbone metal receptor [Pedobacter hartonius]SEA44272.1 iron complex transport system substrate-binding protein [Pedobacter hartonius]
MKLNILAVAILALSLGACNNQTKERAATALTDSTKIVSLNGSVSEVLAAIGLEKNIAGTDITSNYPASLKAKPKVGHNKNINAEGVMALQPDLIVGIKKEVTPALQAQFKAAGVKLLLVDQDYSVEGTKKLIYSLADSLHASARGDSVIKVLEADLEKVKPVSAQDKKPKVLFIYARGTGTMMVGGTGTAVDKAITLAGGQNAVTEFADYKPLTAEALVKANPDIILLFDSGLQSLGGPEGLAKVQGVKETNAGKNKKIISMDGELLSSFGPRLGIAIQELAVKIK